MIFQKSLRYRFVLTGVLCGVLAIGYAQEEETQRDGTPATVDSIDVIRDYRPVLADAVKIRQSPDMTNKRQYQPEFSYSVIDKKLDINTGTKRLAIQEMPFSRNQELTNNYAKIGAGNLGTLLGEVYLSSDYWVDTRVGGYFKHLNQKGSFEGQKFSSQHVGVFGRTVYGPVTLDGEVGYKRYGTGFYSTAERADGTLWTNDPVAKQAFNDIYFTGEITSNYEEGATDAFDYSLKADAYLYSNAFDTKENSLALAGYINKQINVFNVGLNLSGDFTKATDAAYSFANNIGRINPYIRFQGPNYNITLGANFVAEFGNTSRTNIFPSAEVDFALVPKYAHLFGGINGDVNKTSFKTLTQENPWLAELGAANEIRNSVDRMYIFGGIKGNAGATFGYKVKAFYRRIESMPFYAIGDEPYRFHMIYEDGDDPSTVVGLEGEVNVRVSEVVTLGGKLNFNEFDLQQEEEAWYLPKMRLAANARFNISDKLYVDAELLFNGQTYGRIGNPAVGLPGYAYSDIGNTGARKVTIPSFADLSAGAEYRATDRIGVYVRLNNMLGSDYERYLFYPRLGLNVIGGVNFSF